MTAQELIQILSQLAALSPVGVNIVKELISGLQGKSDAEILAQDATTWSYIVAKAHAAQQ